MTTRTAWTFHRLTPERWDDLEALFGERGACGGCWCMVWRLSRSRFDAQKGAGNRRAFKRLVTSGGMPGVLAYVGGQPVGWCAVAPRENYPALARSRVLKPVDGAPVWSISCLFIAKSYRRQGLSAALLETAAQFARSRGAKLVEGYPVEPSGALPDPFVWTGLASAFKRAGFAEVARRSPARPIMRKTIAKSVQPATGSGRGVGSRRPSR